MMESNQAYQYTTLQPGPVFRFLILHPGQGNETLECSLHASLLDEAPDYEAISYVWGLPTRDQTIFCHGKPLMITRSLTKVLKRLRLPSEPRALWADSICINQEDNGEKGHQVALMARIYLSAKRCLICMGDDAEGHAETAFKMIEEINGMIEQSCKTADGPWSLFPGLSPEDPIMSDTRWNSVAALYRSPWFGRGWVVQEAWLGADGLVIWGQHETSWAKLMRLDVWVVWFAPTCAQTFKIEGPAVHWQGYFAQHQNEVTFFARFANPKGRNLLSTLESSRLLGLTDPRDRIYAFLGLMESDDKEGRLQITPNYEHDYLKVYEEFARLYISAKRSVDLFDYVQHTEHTADSAVPSWAPRWDIPPEAGSRLYLPMWPALKDRSSSIPNPLITDTKLSVGGVILDTIIRVSKVLSTTNITHHDIADIWKTFAQFDATPYPPHSRFHAFIETLYGGISQGRNLELWRRAQAAYLLDIHHKSGGVEVLDSKYWKETAQGGDMQVYHSFLQILLRGKRVFLTRRGLFGAAYTVREGDWGGIIFGCKTPSILRKVETIENTYRLLGPAYITGTKLQIDQEQFRGFTVLGREESKDWTEWNIDAGTISLC